MAPVALSFVVRFSSEDAIFKAENLCKGKADNLGTWKIAKEDMSCGRMEAEFQLEKASYISHIDVGNCGSAFIEILVGNSMWPQDKPYVTLLPSAMLMSPVECKHWTKTHTVRMFSQSAFSKQALGSQWDRVRVICRQPFRKDKQFGLSFMRMGSVPDEPTSSPSSEGASGKVATPRSGHLSEEETDDGVHRLKKASGLMGCLRNFEKGSPEIPLNRAGKMLQAALDVRSPGTPRNKRTLSQSSSEISSSPESPFTKKNFQSPSEEPNEKKKKQEKKWSLSGDIYEEVALFLEEIDFTLLDFHHITFKDLKYQMEEQRGCPLTKLERKVFLELAKAAIAKVEDETEDVFEAPITKCNKTLESKNTVTKEPDETRKHTPRSSNSKTLASQKMENKNKKPSTSTALSPNVKSQRFEKPVDERHHVDLPSTSSNVLVVGDDEDDLPPMLYSSEQKMHSRQKVLADKSPASSLVECPLCSCLFPAKEVEFHAAFCTGDSDTKSSVVEPEVELMQCPICSKLFPVSQIEQHADECIEATITEYNTNIRREHVTT